MAHKIKILFDFVLSNKIKTHAQQVCVKKGNKMTQKKHPDISELEQVDPICLTCKVKKILLEEYHNLTMLQLVDPTSTQRFVRQPFATRLTTVAKSSIPSAIENDGFPIPIVISTRNRVWILQELLDWMNSKIKQRDTSVNTLDAQKGGK